MGRELIFSFTKKDFNIQTFCTGGPGGQNQNKNSNGVRIVHKESGLFSESRVHKSQKQNKKAAFRKLCDKLVDHYIKKDPKKRYSAPIKTTRSYNESKDRVVDHVTGKKYSYKHTVGKGDISEIIEDRIKHGLQ